MTFAPYAHQIKTADLLRDRKKVLLRHEVGVGKTISVLLHCSQVPAKTLVLAPKAVIHSAWVQDAEHFPQLRVRVYHGSKRAKALAAAADTDIVITTHDTFRRDVAVLERAGFTRFVIDESSKIKSRDSGITEAAIRFARRMDRVVLLSGTPAPNTPAEYWPQLACIDPSVLGLYWNMVREYFVPVKKTVYQNGRRLEVIAKLNQTEDQRRRFSAQIASHVDSLSKAECLSLPKVTDTVRLVELSNKELAAYEAASEDLKLIASNGEQVNIQATTALGKLRQITGGAVYVAERATIIGQSKLDALEEVLDEIGHDEPVVIWAEYTHEIDRIAQRFKCAIIDGRTRDAAGVVKSFQDGVLSRVVCHPQACGHGITLTRACHAVFYSLSFSAELFEQAKGRLDRAGQTRPVTNTMLIAHDTIDSVVYRALKGKQSVSAAVLASIIQNQQQAKSGA